MSSILAERTQGARAALVRIDPVWLAVLGSLFASLITWLYPDPINNDGVLYLRSAAAFADGGFAAAAAVYSWPFYSAVIALLAQSGLDLLAAAALVNAALYALLSASFVLVVRQLAPDDRPAQLIAVAAVLLLPELTELRHEVVRDGGYLAFLLLSLVALLQLVRQPGWWTALLWLLAGGTATLFRIEAALLGVAGVCALLCLPGRRRIGAVLLGLGGAAAVIAVLLVDQLAWETRVADLVRWWEFYTGEFVANFTTVANRLIGPVLNEYSKKFARDSAVAIVAVLLVGTTLKGLTPVHALAAWKAAQRPSTSSRRQRVVLLAYAIATLLPPALFALQHFFLTQRYVMGFIMTALVLAPIGYAAAYRRWGRAGRLLLVLVLCLFAAATVRKLVGADDEAVQAGRWLAQHSESLWTNKMRTSYYADPQFRRVVVADSGAGWEERLPAPGEFAWLAVAADNPAVETVAARLTAAGYTVTRQFRGKKETVLIAN